VGLPVDVGSYGDEWIGPRIALDARISLLAETLGEIDGGRTVRKLARLLRELRYVQGALDGIVETADASPEIVAPLGASLSRYVDDVYAWSAGVGAAIDAWAASGASIATAALASRRFRERLADAHASLESACRTHRSMASLWIAAQAVRLRMEMAQLDAELTTATH
jgi:hypothetical protein